MYSNINISDNLLSYTLQARHCVRTQQQSEVPCNTATRPLNVHILRYSDEYLSIDVKCKCACLRLSHVIGPVCSPRHLS